MTDNRRRERTQLVKTLPRKAEVRITFRAAILAEPTRESQEDLPDKTPNFNELMQVFAREHPFISGKNSTLNVLLPPEGDICVSKT
jgi:hypothetical protein